MVRTEKTTIILMFIVLLAFLLPQEAASAGNSIYRCKNSDGSIEITDRGCSQGTIDKYYSPKILKKYSGSGAVLQPKVRREAKNKTKKKCRNNKLRQASY